MFRTTTVAALFVMAMAGCESPPAPELEISRDMERALLQTHYVDAIDAGVIRQQTIQPYHFVDHMPTLNELGRRDIEILARHYRRNAGDLRIRRGDTEELLYLERVQEVRTALLARGADLTHVNISDGLPGGDGLESDRVVDILSNAEESESSVYVDNPDIPYAGSPDLPLAD
jgi:hypothetical protein